MQSRFSEKASSVYEAPTSQKYIIFAVLAAVCFAVSFIIRGLESAHVLSAKFVTSLAFLISSFCFILIKKSQAKLKGETYVMPWYTNEDID